MASNAVQRTVAIDREASFGSGIADWTSISSNGGGIRIFDLDISGLRIGMLEDKNYRRRPGGEYPMFQGLRNGSFSFSFYRAGNPASPAGAGVRGQRRTFDDVLLN